MLFQKLMEEGIQVAKADGAIIPSDFLNRLVTYLTN
jgi:ketopantoate reductase